MTLASFVAQSYINPAAGQLQASDTISTTDASNLSDLEDKLAKKVKEQGAKGFVVDSAGGKNQIYGTATIYKQPPPQPNCIQPECSFPSAIYVIPGASCSHRVVILNPM